MGWDICFCNSFLAFILFKGYREHIVNDEACWYSVKFHILTVQYKNLAVVVPPPAEAIENITNNRTSLWMTQNKKYLFIVVGLFVCFSFFLHCAGR